MITAKVATAFRAYARRFSWTAAPAARSALPASGIRTEADGVLDASRALRRAFSEESRRAELSGDRRESVAKRPAASSGEPPVRPESVILEEWQGVVAAGLREAFEAGKADMARELNAAMAGLLRDLAGAGDGGPRTDVDAVAHRVGPAGWTSKK